ncbi:hypothetical protein [Streptomyces leeuwenhoekii]|uniref:Sle1_121 protein n=1 Tax=Streptomyces leeuwenhoekii TaxID=1437453 RepID=A0A0F7VMH9_STRLW|nr:hypothetical protein [Streptomyces leeuwenhoekii]CQR59288.1 sle1_121 [Streptomyces leeuwenhoekii]
MRAPAQHRRPGLNAAHGWAHPYTGIEALATFYNDGGDPPTPADIPPKRTTTTAGDPDTVVMPQEKFTQNMTEQRRRGRHAAYREIAEAAGIDFDVDTFDPKAFAAQFKEAQAARQALLTEEQRRAEELAQKEQALAAREQAAAQREAEAARLARDVKIRAALVRLGATGDDLDDAAALMRIGDDADDDAITQAAEALKARRGELFGATPAPAPSPLPPAPGGAPAGGGTPRPAPSKDDAKARARELAVKMGYAKPAA